jgi:hypothetical protein
MGALNLLEYSWMIIGVIAILYLVFQKAGRNH